MVPARSFRFRVLVGLATLIPGATVARAADRMVEHVTLTNGFDLICDHHEQSGERMRLYTESAGSNFIEVPASQVASFESIALPADKQNAVTAAQSPAATVHADLSKAELHELLSAAGASHNLDVNLLASVVRAESGGHTQAVSKKGAKGLMQLMPKTAAELGVDDSFLPEQNIAGGTAYLDSLLTHYHDNLALALAAYNAGPAAVDRYHGVPPYRETRLYVARIIRDFNASVKAARLTKQTESTVNTAEGPSSSIPGVASR